MNSSDLSTSTGNTAFNQDPTIRVQNEYGQLRQLAARKMKRERCDHLLTATALANEVSIRMLTDCRMSTDNRDQFFAYAATAMGNLLIDHARAQRCQKRGGGQPVQTYDDGLTVAATTSADVGAVREALAKLRRLDSRRAQVVQLRYFDGLSNQEIADQLCISLATVKRDWEGARAWLQQELSRDCDS